MSILFKRYGIIFFFLLLEVVALSLVVRFNNRQKAIYNNTVDRVLGNIFERYTDATSILVYPRIADSLAIENAELRAQLLENRKSTSFVQDSVQIDSLKETYTFIAAKVVDNSINKANNYIVIDKGSKHGVKPHMGLITKKGAVGIVRAVGKEYSLAMSILHRDAIVNAAIKGRDYFGPMVWRNESPLIMNLNDIPRHATLEIGDTVQTTGYSTIFPTNIPIGVIDNYRRIDGDYSYYIEVKLFEDVAKLDYVYVVNHLYKAQIEELEKEVKNE